MSNSDAAKKSLELASNGDLQEAIVIGKDSNGKISLYTRDVDKERMVVLLERARNKLIKTLDD